MENKLTKLRKENNLIDKQLSKENNLILTDMVCYLHSSDICEYDIEVIRKELTGMALEAQLRSEKFRDVIGEDYKELCDELMKNSRKKTLYEKLLENLYILVHGIGILFIFEVITTPTIKNIFKYGSFKMDITTGFAVTIFTAVAMAFGIYYYITKKALESSSLKYKLIFIISFTAIWTSVIIFRILKGKAVMFQINCIYPLVFFAFAYAAIIYLDNRHANTFFTRTNK